MLSIHEIFICITFFFFCFFKTQPVYAVLVFLLFVIQISVYISRFFSYYFTRILLLFTYFSLIRVVYCFILISINFKIFVCQNNFIYNPYTIKFGRFLSSCVFFRICFIWYVIENSRIFSKIFKYTYPFEPAKKFEEIILFFSNDLLVYQTYLYNYYYTEMFFFGILFFFFINIFLLFCFPDIKISFFETDFYINQVFEKIWSRKQQFKKNSVVEWDPKLIKNKEILTLKPYFPQTPEEWKKLATDPEALKKFVIAFNDAVATVQYTLDQPKFWYIIILFCFFFFLYNWIYIRFYTINLKFIAVIYRIFGIFIYSLGSFDFLVNSFRVICISLLQVFLLFVEPENKKLIKKAPQYLIYTRVSSIIFLIGTLILRIYLSSNLRDLWYLVHEVRHQTFLLKFRSVCLLLGLGMKRGIFPFSFYHLPVYKNFSMPVLFFSQSILKLIYGSFFLKYFAFSFALNSYFVLWFLFIRIITSLLYSSIRALLEKSFNLFIVFSGFANFRFFLIPCLANNYNGKEILHFFNFTPLIYGCGYLLLYVLGILRFFYFISTYPDLVSDNIHSFSKLKNCANKVKRKFFFILIYLSSVPPSPLFFFKIKILLDFLALSTNYFFFGFFLILGSITSFYYLYFIRMIIGSFNENVNIKKQFSKIHWKYDLIFLIFLFLLLLRNIKIFIIGVNSFPIWFSRIICECIMNPSVPRRLWI